MKPKIIIIGAGGHGRVVYDAIIAQNKYHISGFVDSILAPGITVVADAKVICSQANIFSLKDNGFHFIVAIGNNQARAKVFESLRDIFEPAIIIHPSCVIGSDVKIGKGAVILANAIINVLSIVGENTIVNSGVIIDHEANIGSHVYLKLGTIIGNNIEVENFYSSKLGEIINPITK